MLLCAKNALDECTGSRHNCGIDPKILCPIDIKNCYSDYRMDRLIELAEDDDHIANEANDAGINGCVEEFGVKWDVIEAALKLA